MTLVGIDVSACQSAATIAAWLPKVDFVIIKASEGKGVRITAHDAQVAQARAAGKKVGHYAFAWPENGGAADAANFLAAILATVKPGDILVLDLEPWSSQQPLFKPEMLVAYLLDFATAIKAAHGANPVLYSTEFHLSLLEAHASPAQMALIRQAFPVLWKAGVNDQYVTSPTEDPGNLHGWTSLGIWQWTDKPLDQDVFYGDAAHWDAIAVPAAKPAPAPAPTPAPTSGGHVTYTWRGNTVCACMPPMLDELARVTGAGIYVKPIPGFGSFRNNAASGGTDTGGGHIDIDTRGLTAADKKFVETWARRIGFYAALREPSWWSKWFNKVIYGGWQSHCHMLVKDCPELSAAAKNQISRWQNQDSNGLVGGDLDTGDRTYLRQTWKQYLASKSAPKPAPAKPAPAPAPAKPKSIDKTRPWGAYPTPGGVGSMYGANAPCFAGNSDGGKIGLPGIRYAISQIQRAVDTTVDGHYGNVTAAKVKAFQTSHHLTADGIVGPATWAALVKASGN